MGKILGIIPARLGSTRLPRKVLADIHGRPLIWHVWKRVCSAKRIDRVILATDSEEVRQVAEGFGAEVMMTSPECRSGTERIATLIDRLDADLILNVQGDEPLVDPVMLDAIVTSWITSPCDMVTPIFLLQSVEDLQNPNIVKVARASDGRAVYFSRSPVPFLRDYPVDAWLAHAEFWGHIGVYGYRKAVLEKYPLLPESRLEEMERLEQLRFLEAGYTIQTVSTDYRPMAVDVLDDLVKVREVLGG